MRFLCLVALLAVSSRAFVLHTRQRPVRPSPSLEATRIGFVGCGTIASAIATGIATQSSAVEIESIAVTQRSSETSSKLKQAFPNLISIHDDSQEVLERADIVFLCVLPQQTEQVLHSLTFDPSRHDLVSLVSTATLPNLVEHSRLPPERVSKMICLPSVARHHGVCLHCSASSSGVIHPILYQLFENMGGVLSLSSEQQLSACMMTTCVMGPFYGIMKRNRDWLIQNAGLRQKDASYLVIKQYAGMIQDAERLIGDEDRLDDLIDEQTPGGLNEQALGNLEKLGGLETYDNVMNAILGRVRGESDGFV